MKRRNDTGTSSVEFAIVLPVFLLVLFGIIEFGLAWWTYEIVTNAAREGARFGVVIASPDISDAQIQGRVNTYLTNSGLDSAQATVAVARTPVGVPPCPGGAGCQIGVSVTYNLTKLVPGVIPLPDTLLAQAIMRHE